MAAVEPKKPLTAFFIYTNENRESVQKELGTKEMGPVAKCLSERFKGLSASAKAPFDKKAADLKAQYEKDLASFKAAGGVVGQARKEKRDAKSAKAAKKAKKEANAGKPKAPAGGAYGVFLAMNRAELSKKVPAGAPCTAISKVASEAFKNLSAKEKEVYEAKYKEKKAVYEEELQAWKATKETEGAEDDEDDEEDGKPASKKARK